MCWHKNLNRYVFWQLRLPNFSKVTTSRRVLRPTKTVLNSAERLNRSDPSSIIFWALKPLLSMCLETSTKHSQPSTRSLSRIHPIFSVFCAAVKFTKRYDLVHTERKTGKSTKRSSKDICLLPWQSPDICFQSWNRAYASKAGQQYWTIIRFIVRWRWRRWSCSS